jgi:hypothetical protein
MISKESQEKYDDTNKLISLIDDFLVSYSHNPFDYCGHVFNIARKSYNSDLRKIAKTFDAEIEAFTTELMKKFVEHLRLYRTSSKTVLSEDSQILEMIAVYAHELDNSGDPELIKEASVLDEILLTLAAPRDAKEVFKASEDKEIEKLKQKYRSEARDKAYTLPKEQLDDDIKTADAAKAIKDSIKEYRPLESALSTRTCPDHPGAQMARIADNMYQCELDKKIYNWDSGFTTMRGDKVPGGSVSNQTQMLGDRAMEHTSFDTRESKLNP